MSHFFAMGGYAAFVWPAYGLSFLGIGGAMALTMRAYAKAKSLLDSAERNDRS